MAGSRIPHPGSFLLPRGRRRRLHFEQQLIKRLGSGLLPHPALKHQGIDLSPAQLFDQHSQVLGPLGEHEAVPSRCGGFHDVVADARRPLHALDEGTEDILDVVHVITDRELCLVNVEFKWQPTVPFTGGCLDEAPHRSAVHRDQGLEPISTIRSRRESKPSPS